jgi:hypothetical protein
MYDWKKLLDFCDSLLASTIGPDSETRIRTIVSRAYFCTHNSAVDWLISNTSYKKSYQDSHKSVIDEYNKIGALNSEATTIAGALDMMKTKRVKADYQKSGVAQWTENTAKLTLFQAKQTLDGIKNLK